jgi:hypothetical protein
VSGSYSGMVSLSMTLSECKLLCGIRSMDAVRYVLIVVQVSRASCSSGLGSPLCCSQMSFPFCWCLCMNCCLHGRSRVVFCMGWSSVVVSLIVPYSCMFCRMCSAYADWGLLFLM